METKRDITIKYITTLIIITFLMHIIWENAQAPLFLGYQSFSQHFLICFIGTIGDVVITLLVLGFWVLIKKNRPIAISDFIALSIIGFFTAILIEQRALLVGKWGYTSAMPLIPYFQVGFTSVLQMTLLLPLSFYLTSKAYENI